MNSKKWYGVKFLLPYMKRYKIRIILAFLSMTMVAGTSALGAYMVKPILNNIFIEKNTEMLMIIPLLTILLLGMRGIFRFLSTYLSSSVGIEITRELRQEMFHKVLYAEFADIQNKTAGDINARIIQTVLNMRNVVAKTIPNYIISIMTIIALTAMILYLNWKLSLFAIVFVSVIVWPMKYLGRKVKDHVLNAEKMVSKLTNRINESFNHIDLVKVYNRTEQEEKKFEEALNSYRKFQLKLSKYQEATSPIMELFVSFAIASVIYAGGKSVIAEEMSAGDFFSFLAALMMLYGPIKTVTRNLMVLNILDAYVQRVESILNLEQEQSSLSQLGKTMDSIKFDHVSLKISNKTILKNINFSIFSGDTVAIVGKTGAGKSSILSILFGFRSPTSGNLLINNKDVSTIDISSLRDNISYVNQNAGIFNTSIKDNIIFDLPFSQEKYDEAVKMSHCEFINDYSKKDEYVVGENGKRLSGGQRQRVALARALYKDALLFVLDEATSALDTDTENLIQDSIQHIMKSKTTIIIAHRLNTIKMADRILVMSGGEIIESGSYSYVSQTEAFKKNFGLE